MKVLTQSRNRGLTLIELLIAVTIFSIISLGLYATFQSGMISYTRSDSAFNVYQNARLILNRIELDLKNSFIYSQNDSRFNASSKTLDFFTICDKFEAAESNTYACRIKYDLNNLLLKRTCFSGADALKENPEAEPQDLSSMVKEITFQFAYESNSKAKPYDWQDSWPKPGDVEQKALLPIAVKIKLSLIENLKNNKEAAVVEFTKIVPIPLSAKKTGEKSGG